MASLATHARVAPLAPTRARVASRRPVVPVIPAAPDASRAVPRRRSPIVPFGRPRDALVVSASRAVVNAAADDAPDAPVSPFPELEATKASDAERSAALCKDTTAPPSRSPSSSPPPPPSSPRTSARSSRRPPPPGDLGGDAPHVRGLPRLAPDGGRRPRGLDYFGTALLRRRASSRLDAAAWTSGCLIVGCITAMGGGTFRGFALGERPVFWAAEPDYLYISLAASLLTFYLWPAVERR